MTLQAIIEAVRKVTHIAPADKDDLLIGEAITQEGVIVCATLRHAAAQSECSVCATLRCSAVRVQCSAAPAP